MERERILLIVKLAQELGASTAILTGSDPVRAIVDHAHAENIATVIVGRGPRRRWWGTRSLSDRIAAEADEVPDIAIPIA